MSYLTVKESLISVPVPAQTRTYKPVSHKQLIETTLEALDKEGFTVIKELYSSSNEGKQATARYTTNFKDAEMGMMVVWQNSYDKQLSLKFALGGEVFVCSNGMVRGDMGSFKRKHSGIIQEFAPYQISEYIKMAGDQFRIIQEQRNRLKEIERSKKVSAELAGRLFIEENIITATQLGIIKKEIENPSYDYQSEGTMWELYNYVTHSFKEDHPKNWLKRQIEFHDFMVKEFSL